MITVTELPDAPASESAFNSVLEAYAGHGFDQGYARATRDLLSVYPLLVEQFLHGRKEATPQVRKLIRDFGRFVEERVGRKLEDAGFADGGGI